MSLNSFYQTVYQHDTLFRFGNDWPTEPVEAAPAVVIHPQLADTSPTVVMPVIAAQEAAEPIQIVEELVIALPGPVAPEPVLADTPPLRPATPLISQKMLILVDEELLPSDVLFLEKVLKAVNLDVNGVDLLNIHGLQGMDFAPILAKKAVHHFFTFGVPFQRINLDIMMDRYQPIRFDGVTFMMADSLATIEADKNLKRRLWESLQKVFLWR